jgi:hypothetical protein
MPKKNALVPIEYDEISLVDSGGGAADDGSIAPSVLIMKRASCVPPSSTGAKTGNSSQRAKNWTETKHPRKKGQFSETSSASKAANGKGGTTAAKQEADCRKEKSGSSLAERVAANEKRSIKEMREAGLLPKKKRKKKRPQRDGGRPVVKKSESWNTDARLRAIMERKAAR